MHVISANHGGPLVSRACHWLYFLHDMLITSILFLVIGPLQLCVLPVSHLKMGKWSLNFKGK